MLSRTLQKHWEMCIKLRHGDFEEREEAKTFFLIVRYVHPIMLKALKNVGSLKKRIKVTPKNG